MKKNILFVINNLNCGGAEKALISLLEVFDFSMYSVDLYLFKREGIFLNNLPKEVNLLNSPPNYKYFDMSIKKAIFELIKARKIYIAISRILSLGVFRKSPNNAIAEQRMWKYLSVALRPLEKEYDVAIGYLENSPIYFCIDKVKAKKKIGWIHNDYEKLGMNKKIDEKYFKNLDFIFTVSDECLNILKRIFPQYKEKFKIMHNVVSVEAIKRLSLENVTDIKFNNDNINIVSVGRLNYQKGFEMAIEACAILKEKGYKIIWYVIGEGGERDNLENLIKKLDVENEFKLIGIRKNPYPYIGESDIYIQTSRFEGKSIAIDEAKILNKPIVLTNFSTARDQIEDMINGLICDMDSYSIASKIEKLIKDDQLKNRLIENLLKENLGNEYEIDKLYEVIDF